MNTLDIEMIAIGLLRDAKLLGCASREQLTAHTDILSEAQDELARAIEKASLELAA